MAWPAIAAGDHKVGPAILVEICAGKTGAPLKAFRHADGGDEAAIAQSGEQMHAAAAPNGNEIKVAVVCKVEQERIARWAITTFDVATGCECSRAVIQEHL